MKFTSLSVLFGLVFTSLTSAVVLTVDTDSRLSIWSAAPFFDDSVVDGETFYTAHAMADTSSMSLIEFTDDSNVDATNWTWGFSVDGVFDSAFGSYFLSAGLSKLNVVLSKAVTDLSDSWYVYIGIESFFAPENPDSAELFGSSTPFTRDGVSFKELWEEAPQVYLGQNTGFNTTVTLVDPGSVDADWIKNELWGSLDNLPSTGSFSRYAGSYSSDFGGAFGIVGGNAGLWNDGIYEVQLKEVNVSDNGATAAMLGFALLGLAALRRRR